MKHGLVATRKRKPVNLSLDSGVVAAARDAGINLSRVTEDALRTAVKAEQERRWLEDHQDAISAFNDWYAREGDPLAELRVR